MIIDLPSTTSSKINRAMLDLREQGGSIALSRVLTLVIVTEDGQSFTEASPEAYERLILDVLLGEPSLFPQDREVELSWEILDPIEKHWSRAGGPLEQYEPGTWGPPGADAMMARDGRRWRRP